MRHHFKRIFIIAAMAAAVMPGSAFAQSTPVAKAYDESGVLSDVPPAAPGAGVTDTGTTGSGDVLGEVTTSAPAGDVAGETATGSGVAPATAAAAPADVRQLDDSSGSLPFTGLDLGIVALAGLALVALGVALRRIPQRDIS